MNQEDFLENFFKKLEEEIPNKSFILNLNDLISKNKLSKSNYSKLINSEFSLKGDLK